MSQKQVDRRAFFGKEYLSQGLNLTDNAIMVGFDSMVEADNIMVGSAWARRPRYSQEYYNLNGKDEDPSYPTNPKNNGGVAGPPIGRIFEFWRDESGINKSSLMVRQADKIYAIDSRIADAVELDAGIINPLPNVGSARICFQPFFSDLYWCSNNPLEMLRRWDGTSSTVQVITGPPDGVPSQLSVYQNRMVASGVPGFHYRLYFSKINDASDWTIPGTILSDSPTSFDLDFFGDPRGIVSHRQFQNRLYVWLGRAIYEVTGTNATDFVVRPVIQGLGALSDSCVISTGRDIYFLSERGLSSLTTADTALESEYGLMSRDIARLYNEALDKSRANQWVMEYDENENLLFISCTSLGSVDNDVVLVYNTEKKLWTTWSHILARSMTKCLINGENRVAVGREDGIIALLGNDLRLDFGETPYPTQFRTGVYYPDGKADEEHVFEELTILCSAKENATVILEVAIDDELYETYTLNLTADGARLGVDFTLGLSHLGKTIFTPMSVELNGRGFGIQVRCIYSSSVDTEVYGFIVHSRPAGQRRVI